MAFFNADTGELVVRIVYDGLGTAGKTTNLRALHAAFPSRTPNGIHTPAENRDGRTLFFDWLDLVAGHLDDWPLRCQVLTVPGQFAYASRRFRLLQEIDGAILVCDSRPAGIEAARIAAAFLKEALRVSGNDDAPLVLQANKQDIEGALSPAEVREMLRGVADDAVGASAATGEGVRWTLLSLLDRVRHRVRKRLEVVGIEGLPRSTQTTAQLYEALVASDTGDDHSGALEAALAEMK